MRKMAISHDQAIFADYGLFAVFCTPVDGHKLTDGSIIANIYIGIFPLELQILRNSRDHSTRENAAVLTNPGAFHDRHI